MGEVGSEERLKKMKCLFVEFFFSGIDDSKVDPGVDGFILNRLSYDSDASGFDFIRTRHQVGKGAEAWYWEKRLDGSSKFELRVGGL